MKIPINCTSCETPHFDHYECDQCGIRLIEWEVPHDKSAKWKFCPYCGESLAAEFIRSYSECTAFEETYP